MKKIDDKELFHNLSQFLKGKGVELHEGPYAQSIQKGCEILADTVNLSQQAMERAREQMDKHPAHERARRCSPPAHRAGRCRLDGNVRAVCLSTRSRPWCFWRDQKAHGA